MNGAIEIADTFKKSSIFNPLSAFFEAAIAHSVVPNMNNDLMYPYNRGL